MICAQAHLSHYLQRTTSTRALVRVLKHNMTLTQLNLEGMIEARELLLFERLYDDTLLTAYGPRIYFFALNQHRSRWNMRHGQVVEAEHDSNQLDLCSMYDLSSKRRR